MQYWASPMQLLKKDDISHKLLELFTHLLHGSFRSSLTEAACVGHFWQVPSPNTLNKTVRHKKKNHVM